MKPILFNTEMVRAILEDRKKVTRRLIKLKYGNTHHEMFTNKYGTRLIEIQNDVEGETFGKNADGSTWRKLRGYIEPKAPYKKSDILYVRETWLKADDGLHYKADIQVPSESEDLRKAYGYKWHPSIHMPKEAARIFLRVIEVRAERIQDITNKEAKKEGIIVETNNSGLMHKLKYSELWNSIYSQPQPVKTKGIITHYESYPWEDIHETREHNGLPWYVYGNPWVWVIEFEQISKEDAYGRSN